MPARPAPWRPAPAPPRRGDRAPRAVGMDAFADRPGSTLAYGDVKRVELAIALASRPKLLLMDEPTAGMAPRERAALMELTATIARERRIGVLFTEHDMGAVFAHADRILVLVRGEIIAAGSPDAVRANARVREVYLGDSGRAPPRGARRASAGVSALSRGRGPRRLLRPGPDPVRRLARARAARGRLADGPQRRRQVHDPEGHHGPRRRKRQRASSSPAARSPAFRATASRAPASATCRRTAGSSPT